jgi:CRP-like cAMP-binding protein
LKRNLSIARQLLFIAKRYAAFMRHFADGQMIVPLQRLRTGLAELLLLQPPATGSEEVILNVSQADLASILGSSRQTINGLLKQLEKAGLIKIGFRHIRVIDPAGLSEHAAN